ncbi:MAG: rhomboid family intramembrane serine protease [Saprospiraceae bacterium]|nr:rhomboid family intramembrane serine protease [Saprospiraceae bacterium]
MSIKYNSPVILTFALLCSAIFFGNTVSKDLTTQYFAVGNSVNLADPVSIFNLFSHVLGHGSMEHLLGNMTFILLLGPIVEEKYGSKFTLIMIIITALITGLLNITFFNTGLLGASGIVFMLILLVSFTNVKGGQIPLTFILVALLFIGKEVVQSLNSDNVSQFAHIIGGICGSFFGFFGKKNISNQTT